MKRVHEDAHKLVEIGLVEKDAAGKLSVPFSEIRADFVLRSAAYSIESKTPAPRPTGG